MNKTALLIIGIIFTVIVIAITVDLQNTRTVDWTESYNEKSTKPYGTSVFYKELPDLFKEQNLKTVYYTPEIYLSANSEKGDGDHVAEGNYIKIGNSSDLEEADVNALLKFASLGNTVFLSDTDFPEILKDTLQLNIARVKNKDSLASFQFTASNLKNNAITIDKTDSLSYFSILDLERYKVLGFGNANSEFINLIAIPFGEGNVIVHLEPKVFTNYHLLKEDRYIYVEGLISYLPNATIYFDSYIKYVDSEYGNADKKSDLNWFLQQPSFKWAWYLALILTVLFIIFNAKRRQRIIPIVKPLENTTVEFVKTISNLYFEGQNHQNLIEKKILYFLENLRTEYHLDTSELNADFVQKLTQKSGKDPNLVTKTINFIHQLQTQKESSEADLLKLNALIEAFNT